MFSRFKAYIGSIWDNHAVLIFCAVLSAALLVLFFRLQIYRPEILKLEVKWLVVSGVPLIIALIVGRYVTYFKGFGIELRSVLQSSVKDLNLIVRDVAVAPGMIEKGSLDDLRQIPAEERPKKELISFVNGRAGYYNADVVSEYLHLLCHVKFLVIVNLQGNFLCLLPATLFVYCCETKFDEINLLVNGLAEGNVEDRFREDAITETVSPTAKIIGVWLKMRASKHDHLPVVTGQRFKGIVSRESIDRSIAEAAIAQTSASEDEKDEE